MIQCVETLGAELHHVVLYDAEVFDNAKIEPVLAGTADSLETRRQSTDVVLRLLGPNNVESRVAIEPVIDAAFVFRHANVIKVAVEKTIAES